MSQTTVINKPAYLRLEHSQLLVCFKKTGEVKQVILENMRYLILDHAEITISQPLLRALGEANVAVIICDSRHLPLTLTLPLYHHHLANERFRQQMEVSLPLKKQLWKRIIQRKIENQARLLEEVGRTKAAGYIKKLRHEVRAGDTTNREAHAARHYWQSLFGDQFVRQPESVDTRNAALNYGYAILRAMTARALLGSGLLPMAGIHHKNKYNPYCLADDVMEPYRPFIDQLVYHMAIDPMDDSPLSLETRKQLLQVSYLLCRGKQGRSTLHQVVEETTKSFYFALQEANTSLLTYPQLPTYACHQTP